MRFIPKKKEIIVETETNPLETNSVDLSYDELQEYYDYYSSSKDAKEDYEIYEKEVL